VTDFVDLLEAQLVDAHSRRDRLRRHLPSRRTSGALVLAAAAAAAVVLVIVGLASPERAKQPARPAAAPTTPATTAPRTPSPGATPTTPTPPTPRATTAPTAPVPSGAPTTPVPSGVPATPAPSGVPAAPVPRGAPTSPAPSGVPAAPVPRGAPVTPVTPAPSGPTPRPATVPTAPPAKLAFTVAVLNATRERGVARSAADRLVRAGYRIGVVSSTPGPPRARSVVLYKPGSRAAALALAKRLRIARVDLVTLAIRRSVADKSTVVVVLGADHPN
jgi:hypothetical protein